MVEPDYDDIMDYALSSQVGNIKTGGSKPQALPSLRRCLHALAGHRRWAIAEPQERS